MVKPLQKKTSLDKNIPKYHRPISNLPFLSKILKKVVLHQLLAHLQENNFCNPFLSAYHTGHSTETTLLHVVNDLLTAMVEDKVSVLLLLALSAPFDTIDHQFFSHVSKLFLASIPPHSSGFDHIYWTVVNNSASSSPPLMFGVPQGLVLDPVLFVLYITPPSDIIASHLFGQPSAVCRWHPTSKINFTKRHTNPYMWPAIVHRWYKIMDVQQSAQT